MANLLGIPPGALDVPAFLAAARLVFLAAAVGWAVLQLRVRRPAWALAGVLAANAFAWTVTNLPLQRMYALGPSHDRVNNLAMVQVVAAGGPALQTIQVGQKHFEPFWGFLVALLSGRDTGSVLRLYPFLSLLVLVAVALAVYRGLRPPEGEEGLDAWERAAVAGFFTLLSSLPLDFTQAYRVPWAMTFLLKPNHALGLVLLPLVLRAFAGIRTGKGRVGVGVLLHLVGWAFVIHMAFVCAGLVLLALWSTLARHADARKDRLDCAVVIGVNLAVVSPYLVMLATGYPILHPGARQAIPPFSAHALEVTLNHAPLLVLGAWGARVFLARGGRLARVWVAQLAAAVVLWMGYYLLSPFQVAKERDELFYWVRFLTAALAGIGAWDLLGRLPGLLRERLGPAPARAAALTALAAPFALPAWWDPPRMDPYFVPSLAPLPAFVERAGEYLRENAPPGAVVAGDREFARWAAALAGRQSLLAEYFHMPRDYDRRQAVERALVRGPDAEARRAAREQYGVLYLAVTPQLLLENERTLADLQARPDLVAVHRGDDPATRGFVVLFELREPS